MLASRLHAATIRPLLGLFIVCSLTQACASDAAVTTDSLRRPNILIIVADDLGYSDIGAYGGEIETPYLDKLAQSGVNLSRFYAAPTCSPSRAMLLTGTDNHRNGLGNMGELIAPNQAGVEGYEGYLNNRTVTIARLLRDGGYNTYMSGKWHLGGEFDQLPARRGFDQSFIQMSGAGSHFGETMPEPPFLIQNMPPVPKYWEGNTPVYDLPENFYSSDFFTDKLLGYIEADRDTEKPFFGYLAFSAPHWPLQAPESYLWRHKGRYDQGYDKVRQNRYSRVLELGLVPEGTPLPPRHSRVPAWSSLSKEQQSEQARLMEIYAAMVMNMDANIGRVVNYLKRNNQFENTFILFLSDNGADPTYRTDPMIASVANHFDNRTENLGFRNSFNGYGPGWAQVSATPFSGYKMSMAEGGIRVPAIMHFGSYNRNGRWRKSPLSIKDVVPTILDLVEIPEPGNSYQGRSVYPPSGKSFLPLLKQPMTPNENERSLGMELLGRRTLIQGDWKLLWLNSEQGGRWALYNVAEDPLERKDLSHQQPKLFQRLKSEWKQYVELNGVRSPDKTYF